VRRRLNTEEAEEREVHRGGEERGLPAVVTIMLTGMVNIAVFAAF